MNYIANQSRYNSMVYNCCGKSGLLLPAISLGLWHNFGETDNFDNAKQLIFHAFDHGITHFDLANNYGNPPGSAESNLGKILKTDLSAHRDELIIATKAGYDMWPGPYGNNGSRKYLVASLDQSLKRLGLDYVDIFYHHRPDNNTPLEESMQALTDIVRSGKALYVAISNYPADLAAKAFQILKENKTPCVLHQAKYNMFVRWIEKDLLAQLDEWGVGCIAFSPLAEGLLSGKYNHGIPENSRAAMQNSHLKMSAISPQRLDKISKLSTIADSRNQTIAQLSLSWILRSSKVTSVLIGASSVNQLNENIGSIQNLAFSQNEIEQIEQILNNGDEFAMHL